MKGRKSVTEYKGLREPLRKLLVCPQCKGDIMVRDIVEGTDDALVEGTLHCMNCEGIFNVRRGIPILISGELGRVEKETAKSFGYQWQVFSKKIPQWERKCHEYFSPFEPHEIGKGKVLDAGCGYGRWLYEVSKGNGVCIGMDLSDAVFAAADFLAERENCHLVQGDILNPPLKNRVFDTVYSIGVLHHLPKGANQGIHALLPLMKKNGLFFMWLYGRHRGDEMTTLYSVVRKLTSHLPNSAMHILCTIVACFVMAVFVAPKRFLSFFEMTKSISDYIPFHSYRYLPFSELRTDLFDMYATPSECGYAREEVYTMLQENGLREIQVTPYGIPRNPEASWRGWGRAS